MRDNTDDIRESEKSNKCEDLFIIDEYFKEVQELREKKDESKFSFNFENSTNNSSVEYERKIWDSVRRDPSPDFTKKFEKLREQSKNKISNKNDYFSTFYEKNENQFRSSGDSTYTKESGKTCNISGIKVRIY